MTITITPPLRIENLSSKVKSPFGPREDPIEGDQRNHLGIDLTVAAATPVYAAADGYIVAKQVNETAGYGNSVVLLHENYDATTGTSEAFITVYAHMQGTPLPFANKLLGDFVTRNEIVGYVGKSGRVTGVHLHFEIRLPPGPIKFERSGTRPVFQTYGGPSGTTEALQGFFKAFRPQDPAPYLGIRIEPQRTERQLPSPSTPLRGEGAISPYIASYKSFHPKIQYELTRRKFSTETVDSYMPFVNLTALLNVEKTDMGDDVTTAWCPSLGIHNNTGPRFGQLYNPTINVPSLNNRSVVGVATIPDRTLGTLRTFSLLAKDTGMEPMNIPYPGIVSVNTEKSLAGPMGVRGGLFRATIKIMAYSVGQVDTLLKYFLRPSTPLVLEFGRMSTKEFSQNQLKAFNWNRPIQKIGEELQDIVRLKSNVASDKLINRYVYDNDGNYEILVGYAVKFNIKQNKDNAFEIDLSMNSTQQFELTNVHSGVKANCPEATTEPCFPVDIREYFSDDFAYKKQTFEKMLNAYAVQTNDNIWKNDIVGIVDTSAPRRGDEAATGEKGYLVTWRFFVEVILNNEQYGLLSIFPGVSRNIARAGMISTAGLLNPSTGRRGTITRDDTKLIPNEVGYHPFLRSTNPGVMLIINKYAQENRKENGQITEFGFINTLYKQDTERNRDGNELPTSAVERKVSGDNFVPLGQNANPALPGISTLLEGVWINTNAIKEAFTRTDTVSQAIQALLTEMNTATEGYWNLQLLSNDDTTYPGLHVVDMALSKKIPIVRDSASTTVRDAIVTSITDPISNKNGILRRLAADTNLTTPNFIYVFNEGNRYVDNGDTIGSELLDLNVNLDLPVAVATQVIAGVGGSAQKGTLKVINTGELDRLKIFPADFNGLCSPSAPAGSRSPCGADPIRLKAEELLRLKEKYEKDRRYILLRDENAILIPSIDPNTPTPTPEEEEAFLNKLGPLSQLSKRTALESLKLRYEQNVQAVNLRYLDRDRSGLAAKLRSALSSFSEFGSALQYVEFNTAEMLRRMNRDSTTGETNEAGQRPTDTVVAHAFNSSNLTKVLVDITLPGIGGIQTFQTFLVDRIPSVVTQGFYIVTKIVHELSVSNGWITKIQGRFRYAPQPSTTKTPAADFRGSGVR